jgi:hypothetical protein
VKWNGPRAERDVKEIGVNVPLGREAVRKPSPPAWCDRASEQPMSRILISWRAVRHLYAAALATGSAG